MNHVDSILSAEKSDCYPDRLIFFTKYKNFNTTHAYYFTEFYSGC